MARILVNGATEYFAYQPLAFIDDPEDEEPPPSLLGDIPIEVPGLATVTGVFREDQVAEASLDLDIITRGGGNPFAALLTYNQGVTEFSDPAGGAPIPAAAFASMVRFDLAFTADRHMVLEYAVRVRDRRRPERLHSDCLDLGRMPAPEACASDLTVFSPADYAPPEAMP